jgi:hypothetical protein
LAEHHEKLVEPRKERVNKIEKQLFTGTEDITQLIEEAASPKKEVVKKKKTKDEDHKNKPPVFQFIPPKDMMHRLIRKATLMKGPEDMDF